MRPEQDRDDADDRFSPDFDALERLQNALLNPLTTVRGRAQLLARRVERLDGIDADQHAWLLHCAATIDAAVTELVTQIRSLQVAAQGPSGDPAGESSDGADVTPIRLHPTPLE
jgi:hypothetical protein